MKNQSTASCGSVGSPWNRLIDRFSKVGSAAVHPISQPVTYKQTTSTPSQREAKQKDEAFSDSLAEDAHARLNQLVLSGLTQQIQYDPSSDLSARLRHEADAYPMRKQLVYELAIKEKTNISGPNPSNGTAEHVLAPPTGQHIAPLRVLHPVRGHLARALGLDESHSIGDGEVLPQSAVDALSDLLVDATVLWELGQLKVLRLDSHLVVKTGPDVDYQHVVDVDYLREEAPELPIPEVYGVLASETRVYLVTALVYGEPLDKLWPQLRDCERASIQQQLNRIFSTLRGVAIPPSATDQTFYGSGSPRRCKDLRRELRVADNPVTSEEEFNKFLLDIKDSHVPSERRKMVFSMLRPNHDLVFSHGDLHPRNIMVSRKPGSSSACKNACEHAHLTIEGLIDWECCGWYPSYWDYTKAIYTLSVQDGCADWWLYLPEAIGRWGSEYALYLISH